MKISPRFSRLLPLPFAFAALLAFCPTQTRGDTTALSFTGGSTTTYNFLVAQGAGFPATVGWAFTLSSPVTLTALGLWDPNGGSGFALSHQVTLWTSAGVQQAQTSIPAGTGATLTDGFRYASIAPLVLAAGSYTIAASYSTQSGGDAFIDQASSITTASGISYVGSRSLSGNGFPPTDFFFRSNSYFGPNFQFTTTPSAVPEPASTGTLLLLSVMASFALKFLATRRLKLAST
ncbi:MAG: hypothetical protein ACXWBM_00755 [Chthoniobacterales bacterium]